MHQLPSSSVWLLAAGTLKHGDGKLKILQPKGTVAAARLRRLAAAQASSNVLVRHSRRPILAVMGGKEVRRYQITSLLVYQAASQARASRLVGSSSRAL